MILSLAVYKIVRKGDDFIEIPLETITANQRTLKILFDAICVRELGECYRRRTSVRGAAVPFYGVGIEGLTVDYRRA